MRRIIGLPRTWDDAKRFSEQAQKNKSNDLIKTNHKDYLLKEDEEKIEEKPSNLFRALIASIEYELYIRRWLRQDKRMM